MDNRTGKPSVGKVLKNLFGLVNWQKKGLAEVIGIKQNNFWVSVTERKKNLFGLVNWQKKGLAEVIGIKKKFFG